MTINLRTVQTDQTLSISNRDLQERVKKAEIMAQKLKQTEDGDTGTADEEGQLQVYMSSKAQAE